MIKGIGITTRMLAAFAALLLIIASVSGFAVMRIGQVNDVSIELRNRWLPATQLLGDLHAYTSQFRIQQNVTLTAPTPHARAKAKKIMANQRSAIDGMMRDYSKLVVSADQKTVFSSLETDWANYKNLTDRMVSLSDASDPNAEAMYNGEALDMFYSVEDEILQLIDLNVKGGAARSAETSQIYANSNRLLIGAALFSLCLAALLAWHLLVTVARPIREMAGSVKRLVDGDLDVTIPAVDRHDEIGSLGRALDRFKSLFANDKARAAADLERAKEIEATISSIGDGLSALARGDLTHRVDNNVSGPFAKLYSDFNGAVGRLRDTLSGIVSGCNIINDGTNEIAMASGDLSARTETQAEALGHTAKTLGEFSEQVRVAAESAKETSSRLAVARASAEKVDETAKRAVIAMRTIEGSSNEMAEIISTIDGLAFQTNLLALNASVEAARAGSAGAGFAVVANEVRHLAQRSADAASSIRQLVATSGAQINEGVTLVENSNEALRRIVTEVTEVSDLMDGIAEAAEKQASGISNISSMVASMDQATQQNAAMVEQSTASSRNLSNETQRLFEQLSFFDLGGAQARARPEPAPAPAPTPASGTVARKPGSKSKAAPVHSPATHKAPAAKSRPLPVQGNAALKDDDWAEF